jgi:hypothetical protein
MAGFGQRVPALVDVAMVAHPSVTLFVDLSETDGLGYDVAGRHERGSVVAGLLPGELRVRGQVGECLQIRLSPVVAVAVLGESAELTGMVVALKDVWGRDAGRAEDRLRAAASWDQRFTIAADLLGRRLDARPRGRSGGRLRLAANAHQPGAGAGRRAGRRGRLESQAAVVPASGPNSASRPKRAAQLVRFDHAVHRLAAGHAAARVAAESGYVDQSHLHREVKALNRIDADAVAAAPWLAIDDVAWPA